MTVLSFRRDVAIVLTAFLAATTAAAAPSEPVSSADETTIQVVDYVLRTPTTDLDPKLANAFLDVDIETLPKKKREKARARQLELQTLMKIGKGKKKGGIRWIAPDSCKPKYYGPGDVGPLGMAGFYEIAEDEADFLGRKTQCSEAELMCEFSLSIILTPRKKGPPAKRFFLHERDPIGALLAEYRNPKIGGQTAFFGNGIFTCNH